MFKNVKAKHGLNKPIGIKTKIGLILKKENRREEEEEEEEEKKKRRRREAKIKGMETELKYGIVWICGILRLCMVNSLSPDLGF